MAEDGDLRVDEQAHRFEMYVDGALAGWSDYRVRPAGYAILHTEVDDAYAGQGVGGRLVRAELQWLQDRQIAVLPYCPFVQRFLRRHPELVALVPADRRAEFDLPSTDGPGSDTPPDAGDALKR